MYVGNCHLYNIKSNHAGNALFPHLLKSKPSLKFQINSIILLASVTSLDLFLGTLHIFDPTENVSCIKFNFLFLTGI